MSNPLNCVPRAVIDALADGGDAGLCRVYWGSHGCGLPRGHEGLCVCDCAEEPDDDDDPDDAFAADVIIAGAPPYYGPGTLFYGEDAPARGLPLVQDGAR